MAKLQNNDREGAPLGDPRDRAADLRTLLKDNPRYPVSWWFGRNFWAGAPLSKGERNQLMLDLYDYERSLVEVQHGRELAQDPQRDNKLNLLVAHRMGEFIEGVLKHLTDKSLGLLQALGLIAAIIALLITNNAATGASGGELSVSGARVNTDSLKTLAGPIALASILLVFNIGVSWRTSPHYFLKPKLMLEDSLGLLIARTYCLRIAQLITLTCILAMSWLFFVQPNSELLGGLAQWGVELYQFVAGWIAQAIEQARARLAA